MEFGPIEWRNTFPFHPTTLTLLEAVTSRFFSRTRSAAIFCSKAIDLSQPVTSRVMAEHVWDYFEPELESHPDLRPLQSVWQSWAETVDEIYSDGDRQHGLRAMKFVLLSKIAGHSPTPVQVANALDFTLEIQGEALYEYARFLLERLRVKGSYLTVDRADERLQDRYTVDLGRRVSEMARRQVTAALDAIAVGDSRISAHVLSCCRSEPLPLSEFTEPQVVSTFWQNAPRKLTVEIWNGGSPQRLANRALQVREFGSPEDAVLAIVPPFGSRVDIDKLISLVEAEARSSLWIWQPRLPARDEWDFAREAFAVTIVLSDPGLSDNRRGRALIEHLKKEVPAREAQLAGLVLRLLLEGELKLGNGAFLEASEMTKADNFSGLLEAVGDFAWPQVFPNFVNVAPRARLLTPSNADTLCLEILRRPASEPFFAPSLERLARHIGEPMGVAKSTAGRWRIDGGKAELIQELQTFIADGAPFSSVEAHFLKSSWGLRSEQVSVLVCAQLRSGELGAYDSQGQELESGRIGLPLRRSVHFLRPGRLPDSSSWTKVAVLLRDLCDTHLGAASFDEARKATLALVEWRESMMQRVSLAQARALQLRRTLGPQAGDWPTFDAAVEALSNALEVLPERATEFQMLSRAAQLDAPSLRDHIKTFRRFEAALEKNLTPLLGTIAFLNNPDFVPSSDLNDSRLSIAEGLSQGEKVVLSDELAAGLATFTAEYHLAYSDWHETQNNLARWNSWRRIAQSDEIRVLDQLSTLRNRAVGQGVRQSVEEVLSLRCSRDGVLASGEAVCSSCGLRLGQRVVVPDLKVIESTIDSEWNAFQKMLREKPVQDFLTRAQTPLKQWDGEISSMLPLLSATNLELLDAAFAPRRHVVRSLQLLQEELGKSRTKGEMQMAMMRWLDGGENLAPEDEIELGP